MVVVVAELRMARTRLNITLLLASVVSKFVPVIVTPVPGTPMVGVNAAMTGASGAAVTVKGVVLVAEPVGVVTVIGPDAAPDGTVVTMRVTVAEMTAAGLPLNVTTFSLDVSLNARAMYSD